MKEGKVRYRTIDGALHLHDCRFGPDNGWSVHVDLDRTLARLPIGATLYDVEIVEVDASAAPRHRKEGTVVARAPSFGRRARIDLG